MHKRTIYKRIGLIFVWDDLIEKKAHHAQAKIKSP